MAGNPLSYGVAAIDRQLQSALTPEEVSRPSLKELRWTWTSESPDAEAARKRSSPDDYRRRTPQAYADAVGVEPSRVSRDAGAWEIAREGDFDSRQAGELMELPAGRRRVVSGLAVEKGMSVAEANEEVVGDEARSEMLRALAGAGYAAEAEMKGLRRLPFLAASLHQLAADVFGEPDLTADDLAYLTEGLEWLEEGAKAVAAAAAARLGERAEPAERE